MKKGKLSENVFKRSVSKYMDLGTGETLQGAGTDCAFLKCGQTADNLPAAANLPAVDNLPAAASLLAVVTQTVSLPIKKTGGLAVYAAANSLAAAGAAGAVSATLSIALPWEEDVEADRPKAQSGEKRKKASRGEERLQELMRQINDACQRTGVRIAGAYAQVTDQVITPVVTVTAFAGRECGKGPQAGRRSGQNCEAPPCGLDIVMTKWIGLEGTMILAGEREKELLTRYPFSIITAAQGFEKYLPVLPEAATALKSDVYAMHAVREGGVFGALWELGGRMGVGLSIDLKKIPVKQETIEICEFFDINPYELLSGGSLLLAVEDGVSLVERLGEQGTPACVIGKSIRGNDRVVINGEETRFLGPAGPDEIYKAIE